MGKFDTIQKNDIFNHYKSNYSKMNGYRVMYAFPRFISGVLRHFGVVMDDIWSLTWNETNENIDFSYVTYGDVADIIYAFNIVKNPDGTMTMQNVELVGNEVFPPNVETFIDALPTIKADAGIVDSDYNMFDELQYNINYPGHREGFEGWSNGIVYMQEALLPTTP
jgi:hypothetical protein